VAWVAGNIENVHPKRRVKHRDLGSRNDDMSESAAQSPAPPPSTVTVPVPAVHQQSNIFE